MFLVSAAQVVTMHLTSHNIMILVLINTISDKNCLVCYYFTIYSNINKNSIDFTIAQYNNIVISMLYPESYCIPAFQVIGKREWRQRNEIPQCWFETFVAVNEILYLKFTHLSQYGAEWSKLFYQRRPRCDQLYIRRCDQLYIWSFQTFFDNSQNNRKRKK